MAGRRQQALDIALFAFLVGILGIFLYGVLVA